MRLPLGEIVGKGEAILTGGDQGIGIANNMPPRVNNTITAA